MVRIEEVVDETFLTSPTGESFSSALLEPASIVGDNDSEWGSTDTGDAESIISTTSSLDSLNGDLDCVNRETIFERIYALRDILPPLARARLSALGSVSTWFVCRGMRFSGRAIWLLSTTALLLGVPWAVAFAEDQQLSEMEREERMRSMSNEVLTNSTLPDTPAPVKPAV